MSSLFNLEEVGLAGSRDGSVDEEQVCGKEVASGCEKEEAN